MSYHGFLRLGGVDVVNTERARGYLETSDCPSPLIKATRCDTIQDAVKDDPYVFGNISLAPWYDLSLPDLSSRFYGVVGLRVSGLGDSTRSASTTESVGNGGTVGRVRKGMKSPRVRATLIAQGDDAMEYGRAWLDSAFDGTCGTHGGGCGTMDMEFFADCPPARATLQDFTEWQLDATNLATHGTFEIPGASLLVKTNRHTNPDAQNNVVGYGHYGGTAALSVVRTALPAGEVNLPRPGAVAHFAATADGIASAYIGDAIPVTAGETITLSFYLRRGVGWTGTATPRLDWSNGTRAVGAALTMSNSVYDRYTVTAVVPAGITTARPNVLVTQMTTGNVFRVRMAQIETGTEATEYVDGKGPLNTDSDMVAAWTGVAGNSPSTLTTTGIPVYGTAVARGISSTIWRHSGSRSLRQTPLHVSRGSGYTTLASSSAANGLVRGEMYTISGWFYQAKQQGFAAPSPSRQRSIALVTDAGSASDIYGNAADAVGETEVRMTFTVPATGNWYLRLYNGGMVGDPDCWWDDITIVPGIYNGEPFSGDDANTTTTRYSWVGTPNASTSVLETRAPFDRLQTDAEYGKVVDDLRRFMHNVSVTSGPFVLEERVTADGRLNVVTVEWEITVERPWTYSTTRAVDLPVTPTTVIQDIPFNLVTRPSAEIAQGDAIVATNYSLNPSLEVNAAGWVLGADGSAITTAMLAGGRVTGELRAVGDAAYRVEFTPPAASLTAGSFWINQEVNFTGRPAGAAVSLNIWAAELLMAGNPVRTPMEVGIYWRATSGGTTLRYDVIGTIDVNGGALSAKGLTPPAGANFALVRVTARLSSWPAGSILRLYADALAVTVP